MDNVRFEYLYRDASNYLQRGAVVFADTKSLPLLEAGNRLRRAFMGDSTFAAHQLRLPELFLYGESAASPDDHCLHEFFGLEATDDQPNDQCNRTFAAFLSEVESASHDGWLGFNPSSSPSNREYFRFSA